METAMMGTVLRVVPKIRVPFWSCLEGKEPTLNPKS